MKLFFLFTISIMNNIENISYNLTEKDMTEIRYIMRV